MCQRLGIAAAILGRPKYLMLDEPANGLDPEGIAWLRQFLKEYAAQGNAVFVSSHLLSEMALMADNVVVIGRGKLIASTSMKDLISKNAKSSVFVRVNDVARLKSALGAQSITSEATEGGLKIVGRTTDEVGKLAFKEGLTVLELATHDASLEEAFLELTANAEEYRTGVPAQKAGKQS